ncbi:Cytochrome P450 [Quillaja saponaria]|uniref:Cytochrome P450 n=1 Tax=Quillaja saponaria TaxID=32244 RepID=A0AAD7LGT5_QUISA|nr:Cytochrome P450 [Quillaja saponaria]
MINLSETLMSLTCNVICRVAFGKKYEKEGLGESSRFHKLLKESQVMLGTFFVSDHLPFMGWVDRLRGLLWRLEKNLKEFDVFYQEIIDDHLDPNIHCEKSFLNEDDIQELPYLKKAVVKEALRSYPPVPLLAPRETTQGCNLEGYVIQPKTLVYINAWAFGRDPETWENPEEFFPERFLQSSSIDFKGQDFELIPFGAGRRIFPGMNMGVVTVELVLANLLHSFDREVTSGMKEEDMDTEDMPGVTMKKKNALCLVAKNHIRSVSP